MLKKVIGNASILSIGLLIGRFSGYIREFSIAYLYKTSSLSDSIILILTIPDLLNSLLGAGITSAIIIPYLHDSSVDKESFLIEFFKKIIVMGLIGYLLITIGSFFFYSKEVSFYLCISLLSIFPNLVTVMAISYLAYQEKFIMQSASNFIFNTVFIIFLFSFSNLYLLAFGVVVASVVRMILTYRKSNFKRSYKEEKTNYIGYGTILMVVASNGLFYINPVLDKILASFLKEGSVALLSYAEKLYLLPVSVVLTTVAVSMFPSLSELAMTKQFSKIKALLKKVFTFNIALAIAIALVYFFFGRFIVSVVYKMTGMSSEELGGIYNILISYLPGLCLAGINSILINLLFAFKKYKFSLLYSLSILLLNFMGDLYVVETTKRVEDIALITSGVTVLSVLILWVLIRQIFKENKKV